MRNSFVLSILERVTEPGRPPCSAWIAWLRRNLSSMNEGSLWDAGRMPTRERNGLEDPPKCPSFILDQAAKGRKPGFRSGIHKFRPADTSWGSLE